MTAENGLSDQRGVWLLWKWVGGGETGQRWWGFEGGAAANTQGQSGVPNRAGQLAGHGGAWHSTAGLRADVTFSKAEEKLERGQQGKWIQVEDGERI